VLCYRMVRRMNEMKRAAIIPVGLSLVVVTLAAMLPPIDIRYDHAGLTQITIADNTLKYVTHSLKTNLVADVQDMSSYDRHESVTQLAENDKTAVLAWVKTGEWNTIAKSYPSSDAKSYGTAFRSLLDIKLSGVHHKALWDDTSGCPEIRKAVKDLEAICKQIVERGRTNAEPTHAGDGNASAR
jgi:hypothetical protein